MSGSAMTLRVVTPTRLVVDAVVSEITAPGAAGELGFLPEHVTFLGQLDLGLLTYKEAGATKRVLIHGGYAEIAGDVVTILADDAEYPSEIDRAAAGEMLREIEASLQKSADDPSEVDRLLRQQKLAQTRLAAAS